MDSHEVGWERRDDGGTVGWGRSDAGPDHRRVGLSDYDKWQHKCTDDDDRRKRRRADLAVLNQSIRTELARRLDQSSTL